MLVAPAAGGINASPRDGTRRRQAEGHRRALHQPGLLVLRRRRTPISPSSRSAATSSPSRCMSTTGTISAGATRSAIRRTPSASATMPTVHGTRRIYTPQIVVNGTTELRRQRPQRRSRRRSRDPALPVPVTHAAGRRHGGDRGRRVAAARQAGRRRSGSCSSPPRPRCRSRAARTPARPSTITTSCAPCGRSACGTATSVKITLPEDELMANGVDACAVIVQEDLPNGPGAIIGAAWLGNW